MRDHQIELIAALVEGRLEDESEARALIDSAPEFREEYTAQKIAYEMLIRVGTASLADIERSALHRDVWTSLRQGTDTSPARGSRHYRWVAVAAGMFVVVGLAAVLGQVGGGDSGETFAEMAADQGGATTTAAATDGDSAGADRAEESADDSADTMSGASATTLAGDGSSAPADEDVAAYYAGEAERVRSGEFGDRLQAHDATDSEVEACVADAGLDRHRPVATLVPPPGIAGEDDDPRLAVAVPDDSELADSTVIFVDMSTCEVVHTDEFTGNGD